MVRMVRMEMMEKSVFCFEDSDDDRYDDKRVRVSP